ncbi:bifunctional methionine sulfoxide reductase B/A protein [Candidatus Micrarchaeota archaeon]|nr:bifunctional methionine sulfoxide reductase B/A protein [Candidatus Micrarchaeota archaeon]
MKKLTLQEENVILYKGTEPPFSGEYNDHFEAGTYLCKRCDAPLYLSDDKFRSSCGWPSFDDAIQGAVKRIPDPDGTRTEIQCARCGAHLGHVFKGENLTQKNLRHCVNSVSLKFIPKSDICSIILGGGCFWCIEAVFKIVPGVLSVTPGYAGGTTENPTYEQLCTGKTGHAEVVEVKYNPNRLSLEKIAEVFFAAHDPTTLNRQGNDVGTQYRSIILYNSKEQKNVLEKLIKEIRADYEAPIVTELVPLEAFYPAEDYHKDYFEKNPQQTYCQVVIAPKINKIQKLLYP